MRLIIPSLDRAAQLDCLIRSIREYWTFKNIKIFVLFRTSSEEFYEGYRKLKWQYRKDPIVFIDEVAFCEQIKDLVKSSEQQCIMFGTDDCVMYRSPPISTQDLSDCITKWDDIYTGFSLRLSPDTIIQNYLTGELQPRLSYNDMGNNIIEWNWKRYPPTTNYGYWFSWDFHAYHKDRLLGIFSAQPNWENPRAAEHQFATNLLLRNTVPSRMLACNQSSVFVNTINRVQPNGPEAGTKHAYSVQELNDRLLAGECISLNSFKNINVISCHEEFPLQWECNDD